MQPGKLVCSELETEKPVFIKCLDFFKWEGVILLENQVFTLLKEYYERTGTILPASMLSEKVPVSCTSDDLVDALYRFDAYLDTCQFR